MAARQDPGPARHRDDRRRRGAPRHSIAETDPLRWARDDDETTADLPVVSRDTGDTTIGMPAVPPLSRKRRRTHGPGAEPDRRQDSTRSLYREWERSRDLSAATTADLPAVRADADIVDHRTPLERRQPVVRRVAPRGYTAKHRRATPNEPARLGLSTVGMTVAVGVLGAALTIMHTDANSSSDQSTQPPLAAVAPTTSATPTAGTSVQPQPTGTASTANPTTTAPSQNQPQPATASAPGQAELSPGVTAEEQGTGTATDPRPTRQQTRRPARTTRPASGGAKPSLTTCPASDEDAAASGGTTQRAAITQADDPAPDLSGSPTPSAGAGCP